MHYAEIPAQARPLEVAILLLYDPVRDNKKEVRWMLHLKHVSTVRKVVRKYSSVISLSTSQSAPLGLRETSLLEYSLR